MGFSRQSRVTLTENISGTKFRSFDMIADASSKHSNPTNISKWLGYAKLDPRYKEIKFNACVKLSLGQQYSLTQIIEIKVFLNFPVSACFQLEKEEKEESEGWSTINK